MKRKVNGKADAEEEEADVVEEEKVDSKANVEEEEEEDAIIYKVDSENIRMIFVTHVRNLEI